MISGNHDDKDDRNCDGDDHNTSNAAIVFKPVGTSSSF